MRHVLAGAGLAATLLALATTAGAQTVDEVIARHIDARGGYERLKAIQTIRIERVYSTFGANVPVTIFKKRPDLQRLEQAIPGRPLVVRGLSPEGAWEMNGTTVSDRPADQLAELRDLEGDFDGFLVDYRDKGHQVTLLGREVSGGADVYRLQVTLKSGRVRNVYLDADTFLERKQTGEFVHPQAGRVPVTIFFSDWREVEGVKFPFAIDEEREVPAGSIAIYTERIEANVPLDAKIFSKPQG